MTKIKRKNFRYTIFILVLIVALINYIDRGALSYAGAEIMAEFGFNNKDWGNLLGYFGYGYMFGALIGGALADKWGAKKVWIVAGVAWSIFEISTAFAGEIGMMIFGGSALAGFAVIRILFGFSEGPAYSVINKTIGTWATPKERGFVVGIGLLSTPLGALLTAPVAVGLLALTGSWRAMFIILGVVGLIAIIILMRYFTNTPRENKYVSAEELSEIEASHAIADTEFIATAAKNTSLRWFDFFKSRTLVFNTIGYFAFIYVNFLLLTWTPRFLQDQFDYNLSSLWYMGMIPWIGACFTVLLGGRFSDWLFQKTGKLTIARSYFAAGILLLTTLCFLSVNLVTSAAAVIALISVGNALNALANTVYWTVVIDTTPKNKIGTYSGMMHFLSNIGAVLAPTLTGYLVSQSGYSAMFTAAAVVTCIGMVSMLLVKPGHLK
ncbi:MFS transporter [Ignatzschineria rhizosphaerae]|uniref:MFS transporter n=1 Tax=Ignatzschineria rhizosphaerae TaxID=2923279 RepID=A0ABY3X612_9GAMM|nr:MFS transporter [Ignatzschineria rhizosphaerae]UNM96902.1 MFS transporter [Ignatzschineria rhizosphaerae]